MVERFTVGEQPWGASADTEYVLASDYAALEAQLAEAQKDAERYRWLRSQSEDYDGHVTFPDVRYRNGLQDGQVASTVDAAIDAARGAEDTGAPTAPASARSSR